jgi:hypothetical protein
MIQKDNQRTLADQLFYPEKQQTKTAAFLAKMETMNDMFIKFFKMLTVTETGSFQKFTNL